MQSWRRIVTFPHYEVSDKGNVRRVVNQFRQKIDKPIAKTQNPVSKYDKVILQRDGKGHTMWVHQLVATEFLGKPIPGKDHVNHLNGNKQDNTVGNLQWASRSENMRHAYDSGLVKGKGRIDPM